MSGKGGLKVFEICSAEFEVVSNAFVMVFRGALVGKELRCCFSVGTTREWNGAAMVTVSRTQTHKQLPRLASIWMRD